MYHFYIIGNIFPVLTPINKGHDQGNESSGGDNDAYNIKTNESKVETATDTKGADKETENESQERFPDIRSKEFLFKRNAMEGLFFSLSDNSIGETRHNGIIFKQYFGGGQVILP
jgi:hypothetical protein